MRNVLRALLALLLAGPAGLVLAADPVLTSPDRLDSAVFALVGPSIDVDMFRAANPFSRDYEDNLLVGVGYQRFFGEWRRDLHVGAEIGVAGRFGESDSAEIWGGLVTRYDGFQLSDRARLSPAFTFGLSAVTEPMAGRETESQIEDGGDATLLFYLGPELNLSFADHRLEVFWRLHHRSGAWGTLGDMRGAANANVVGVRRRF